MVSVHPVRRCTSPLKVVPVGLGDGAGDCHDVANLPRRAFFLFPFLFVGENFTLFQGKVSYFLCTAGYASSLLGAHPLLP